MKNIKAIRHSVLGFFVNKPGESTTKGGVIVLDDDGKTRGIKSRYFIVHSVGDDNIVTNDIKEGDIICVPHGRWTRGFDIDHPEGKKLYGIDPKDIMGVYHGSVDEIY